MAAAFAAFSDGPSSEDMAGHHAGVATEHLLKAFLVSLHPTLIVDGKDFNSMLYATGHGALLQVRGPRSRRSSSVRRMTEKGKIPPKPKVWPLTDARNGVAHCGYHDRAEVIVLFTDCITVIDQLLVELAIGPDCWGDYKALHDKLLGEGVEAARVRLEGKLARAQRVFAERYGHIYERERELVLTTVARVTTPGFIGEYSASAVCPVCSSRGSLMGQESVDEERWVVVLTPHIFQCFVCDLRLELGELDLLVVPLGDDVDLDVSPEDYYSQFEPDEDYAPSDDEPDYSARLLAYRKR
ncbi:hypothetical protein D7319_14315 [Streptomyces radicis]|uniref:Uncharacterized protein n=2 Tax=Streptomyces radicis TaxID=1750517 RepID=A0A3A9W6S7_9ACTN|nr:hypothetical protein D7319_14315 [Streptomyces radicis]RKN21728.1 hypothetical protein D7318_15270 [Streptomyces radicis]